MRMSDATLRIWVASATLLLSGLSLAGAQLEPGTVLVLDAGRDSQDPLLVSVDLDTGIRTVLSDFGDATEGPLGNFPIRMVLGPGGKILVVDSFAAEERLLFEVDPTTGFRTTLSDFGNATQGPGGTPVDVEVVPVPVPECGGTAGPSGEDVPCDCGDTVVTDTRLVRNPSASNHDPVCSTTCEGDGLEIGGPGLFLAFDEFAITGNGTGTGLRVSELDGVEIKDSGRVTGFETGLLAETNDSLVSKMMFEGNVANGAEVTGTSW